MAAARTRSCSRRPYCSRRSSIPHADDAVNYGAIGAVIGHEISHGFDDQGRKFDATGAVRDWWTAEDNKRFNAEAKLFGERYAKFEAAAGSIPQSDADDG